MDVERCFRRSIRYPWAGVTGSRKIPDAGGGDKTWVFRKSGGSPQSFRCRLLGVRWWFVFTCCCSWHCWAFVSYPFAVSCLWSSAHRSGLSLFILSSYSSSLYSLDSVLESDQHLRCLSHHFPSFAVVSKSRLLKRSERDRQPMNRTWARFPFSLWCHVFEWEINGFPFLSSKMAAVFSSPEEPFAQFCGLSPGLQCFPGAVPWLFLHFHVLLFQSTLSVLTGRPWAASL